MKYLTMLIFFKEELTFFCF